jgi:tetratricopeptide (TPR) repeat protein
MAELEQRIESASPELRPHIISWTYELAQLYQVFGQYDRAEELLRQLLAQQEQTHGPDSPDVAPALNDLATLLKATNRLSEAEPLMRRALAIDEQSYGAEHPNVASDLNNLALLLQATNRLAEAEPLMRRCVEITRIFRESTGFSHASETGRIERYRELLAEMGLPEAEIERRVALAAGGGGTGDVDVEQGDETG